MNKTSMRSGLITKKGKNYASYYVIDGKRVSSWIISNGGEVKVLNLITNLIREGLDCHEIREKLNISSTTIKNYIINNLPQELIEREKKTRSIKSSIVRSQSIKGKPKKTKGLTYLEIYGTSNPACGFRKGSFNPNFTRDKYIGCTLLNKNGKKFRSSYEVKFSEILEDNNVNYTYEHHFKLLNNKVKIVDFVINDKLVEVTGYAYPKWQQDFDVKISLLHRSYPDKQIVIISSEDKIKLLTEKHGDYCKVLSLLDIENIINTFI
jgi:hypothetical protein